MKILTKKGVEVLKKEIKKECNKEIQKENDELKKKIADFEFVKETIKQDVAQKYESKILNLNEQILKLKDEFNKNKCTKKQGK